MRFRPFPWLLAVFPAFFAHADELGDKVCPLIEQVAAGAAGKADFAVQGDLVMAVGGAYNFDGEALKNVLQGIDASAEAGCPEARQTILKSTGMNTLSGVLR